MRREWQICDYDVLGNATDGYEINDMYGTPYWLDLGDNPPDAEVLRQFCEVYGGKPDTLRLQETMGDVGELYIEAKADGRPIAMLRQLEVE